MYLHVSQDPAYSAQIRFYIVQKTVQLQRFLVSSVKMLSTTLFWSASLFLAVFASTFTDSHFVPRATIPGNLSILIDINSTVPQILAAIPKNPNCGPTPGDCSKYGCQGVNLAQAGIAICTAGTYVGCECQSTCTSSIKCSDPQCQGRSDPTGGVGSCLAGLYAGCNCQSVCGQNGPCNTQTCFGLNNVRGQHGLCTGGISNGCFCNSVCGDHDGSCTSNNCQGVDGVCTAGDYHGCSCGTACGNLEIGKCNDNGCNGVNSPSAGLGVCTSAQLKGCACTNICGTKNGPCSNKQCQGSNGVCKGGPFIGCYCD